MRKLYFVLFCLLIVGCKENNPLADNSLGNEFDWKGANIYFLLTDRFNNGDITNDINFDRTEETGVLRGFEGGDIKGITQKINEGYFTDLGINAIWMTPIVEQIHSATDEGTGKTYGYHGYWTKDWTKIDPNFGTKEDLHELVETAHKNGIRILLDAVINHTGPVTDKDPVWPSSWVRTEPQCQYSNYENTITCTLVKNLPDIKTESNENVDLPQQLVKKWKEEGRYQQEVEELNAFFERTGYPRAPRFYIIKWLTDYITEFGIDGYRCDTVKHTEEFVWEEFKKECDYAFAQYKKNNSDKVLDDNDFYVVGEVYNYGISGGKYFNFGDKKVNYFDNMFTSQINFEFKWNAKQMAAKALFKKYDTILKNQLKDFSVLNYLASHDDGSPFDKERKKPLETATKLLLSPGASQVYYGDEVARPLQIKGAVGDANLRSVFNWGEISNNDKQRILLHWQKLGQFRRNHPVVGAGNHNVISDENGLVFSRTSENDTIVAAINISKGEKNIDVSSVFSDADTLYDFYSNQHVTVKNGTVNFTSEFDIVLLERK